jgi:hypothetical protein
MMATQQQQAGNLQKLLAAQYQQMGELQAQFEDYR